MSDFSSSVVLGASGLKVQQMGIGSEGSAHSLLRVCVLTHCKNGGYGPNDDEHAEEGHLGGSRGRFRNG